MSTRLFRSAFVFVLALCMSLAYSGSNAEAQDTSQTISRQTVPREVSSCTLSNYVIVYSQPPSSNGGLFQSSHRDPGGSNYDEAIWDHFSFQTTQQITEIHWRGGYDPDRLGWGGPVSDFRVAIHASIPAGTEPDVVNPPLVEYRTGGNAGQTPAGTFGGAAMYDYKFTLPAPFQAAAGTKYWLQIEAVQQGSLPDWGMAAGTGSDGSHYRQTHVEGNNFRMVPGDAAFTLFGPETPIVDLVASNDSPTVLGQDTTFTAAVIAGSGVSYSWSFGDGTSASGQVVTHAYAAAGSYTAEVTASNSLGSLSATTAVTITKPYRYHTYLPLTYNWVNIP